MIYTSLRLSGRSYALRGAQAIGYVALAGKLIQPRAILASASRGLHARFATSSAGADIKRINVESSLAGSRTPQQGAHDEGWKGFKPLPPGWEAVIGLEIHVQMAAKQKLFSATPTSYESLPNSHVSLFDAAYPGTQPQLNSECLRIALMTSLALGATINRRSSFDRKHYFYPDLPAGYQITQHYSPLARGGSLPLLVSDGDQLIAAPSDETNVRIFQLQIEQDTAKSTSDPWDGTTLVDLNRAGTGLMEIVTGPDMRTPAQAGAFVRKLQAILRKIGASDGNLDEGSLRCDVNVSIHRSGEPWGTRCEVKNLNGIKFLMGAIAAEAHRHLALLDAGQRVKQETRGYDAVKGETFKLRDKEDTPDYRYIPDPNLPPLTLTRDLVREAKASLPELPSQLRKRLRERYGLSLRDTNLLMALSAEDGGHVEATSTTSDEERKVQAPVNAVEYFEQVAKGRDANVVVNWILHDLLGRLGTHGLAFRANPIPAAHLGELIDLVEAEKVTPRTAKSLLDELLSAPLSSLSSTDTSPVFTLLHSRSALRMDSSSGLVSLCQGVVNDLTVEADKVRKGNERVIARLVGEVMKREKGRVDAKKAGEILRGILLPNRG